MVEEYHRFIGARYVIISRRMYTLGQWIKSALHIRLEQFLIAKTQSIIAIGKMRTAEIACMPIVGR